MSGLVQCNNTYFIHSEVKLLRLLQFPFAVDVKPLMQKSSDRLLLPVFPLTHLLVLAHSPGSSGFFGVDWVRRDWWWSTGSSYSMADITLPLVPSGHGRCKPDLFVCGHFWRSVGMRSPPHFSGSLICFPCCGEIHILFHSGGVLLRFPHWHVQP